MKYLVWFFALAFIAMVVAIYVAPATPQTFNFCPTMPPGNSSNACASTQFVGTATSGFTAISGLTGDVSAAGPGSVPATIQPGVVTSAKMAAGAASTNVGTLGGVLGGTLPNPTMAAGAASTNVGTLGGALSGTLPNPSLAAMTQNAVKGAASSTAVTDLTLATCSTVNSALQWTTNTGFGCAPSMARLDQADQTLTGGANVTSLSLSTGNVTIDCGSRSLQFITNGGAFTITAPANDGSCMVNVLNNGTAGTITFTSFCGGTNHGDALDTTNGHLFTLSIWRINGNACYRVAANQ